MKTVQEYIKTLYKQDVYPDKYIVHSKEGNIFTIEDKCGKLKKVLTFCTNDLLGLAQSQQVKEAAIAAIHQYGTSNSSASILSGRIKLHQELEQEISAYKGLPHTHLFLNAWLAMQALMDGFCYLSMSIPEFKHTRPTLILSDLYNHDCITAAVINATRGSSGQLVRKGPEVRIKTYRHCDPEHLRKQLRRYAQKEDRIMLVSDAIFSMEGNIAPLPELIEVLKEYPESVILMDEAHSSGAIGQTGKGIYEHFGITPHQVRDSGLEPLIMTTFSKFAGSAGAAISTYVPELVDLLEVSRTSAGTISLPPSTAAAALASIREVQKHPELVQTLQANTKYLRSSLLDQGFQLLGYTNIVPVILPEGINPKTFAQHLLDMYNIWVSPIWFIAKPRLRIVVNALHTPEEMEKLVTGMVTIRDMLY